MPMMPCQHPDCPSCGPYVKKNKDAFMCVNDGGTHHCFKFYGKTPTTVELKFSMEDNSMCKCCLLYTSPSPRDS